MEAAGLAILLAAGAVAVAAGWRLVRDGRSVWAVMTPILVLLGVMALLTGLVRAGDLPLPLAIGAGAGLGLYLATAVFLAVARRWPLLARHTASVYELRGGLDVWPAVGLAALLNAPAEELFWRGIGPLAVAPLVGDGAAAPVAWLLYVGANAASGSLPILLGAVVGGGAWAVLAATTNGVAASIACHAVWTGLMIAVPPRRAAR